MKIFKNNGLEIYVATYAQNSYGNRWQPTFK